MGMEIETKFSYYDGPNGTLLVKEATTSQPQGESTLKFHDYVVDGKPVESTKVEEKKPAKVEEKKPEEKKPADEPPAPAPAPKDGK